MKKIRLSLCISALALSLALSSCGSKTSRNINYLQDATKDTTMTMKSELGILVQPKDMISIVVSSRNPELSAMFNLTNVSYQAGAETSATGGYQRLMGYSVDSDGNIEFPIVGKINVAGLTRWQVSDKVRNELITRNLLKDPVVTVEFLNFRRDKVSVVRELNGKRNIYFVDIRSVDLFNSPAYYLQQNDVVMVEPNKVRAGQSTVNENNLRSASFWVSMGSFGVTIANLFIAVSNSKSKSGSKN